MDNKSTGINIETGVSNNNKHLFNTYQVGISKTEAISILRSKVEGRDTLDEKFQSDFLKDCNEVNVILQYYPVVKINAKITSISWSFTTTDTYVSGYSGTIYENGKVDLHKEYSSYKTTNEGSIRGSYIDEKGISSTQIYKLKKWNDKAQIVQAHVKINPEQINDAKEKCMTEISSKLSSHALAILKKEKGYDLNKKSITYSTEYSNQQISFYPVYFFNIQGIECIIDGTDGSFEVPEMPHNKKYYKEKRKYLMKDSPLLIYRYGLLSALLAFMVYVLYVVITSELNSIYMGWENIFSKQIDYIIIWILIIGVNAIACIVWLIIQIFLGFKAAFAPHLKAYIRAEKENEAVKIFGWGVFKYEIRFIFNYIIAFGLVCVYIAISGLLVPGGAEALFEMIFLPLLSI